MKLIIDIDKDIAQGIIDGKGEMPRNIVRSFQATIADAIKNGIPLPKGHGDLIDSNVLCEQYERTNGDLYQALDLTPTIIEADKGNKE